MKSIRKTYLLYAGLVIVGGGFLFVLVQTIQAKNTGFETKTLWDWMELLIIPFFLAGGAFYLNRTENETERRAIEDRAMLEREIAKDRQQEAALQVYLKQMAKLLLKEKLQTTKRKEVHDVARTLTISIMRTLDKDRNNLVIQFLREAKLITNENSILNNTNMEGLNLKDLDLSKVFMQKTVFGNADLHETLLYGSNLQGVFMLDANLQETYLEGVNFQNAYLEGVNFQKVILRDVNLQEADLKGANLQEADLEHANLQKAYLNYANLHNALVGYANLEGANLEGTNLAGANLEGAYLEGANLEGAIISDEQLEAAMSLKDATMPDGTKHE